MGPKLKSDHTRRFPANDVLHVGLPSQSSRIFGPLLQGQTSITKHKSAYNSLIIGPRGLAW